VFGFGAVTREPQTHAGSENTLGGTWGEGGKRKEGCHRKDQVEFPKKKKPGWVVGSRAHRPTQTH